MTILGWLRISGIRWVRISGTHSITLISALVAASRDEYVCLNVCHPMCCAIPIFTAAGRIKLRMIVWPQYGFLPDVAGLANTQSSGFGKVCTPAMSSALRLGKHREE